MATNRGIRFHMDDSFERLRRTPEVEARLQKEVDRILAQVGTDDYAGGVEDGKSRARGYVVTTSAYGVRSEAKHHTLLRLLGGGA